MERAPAAEVGISAVPGSHSGGGRPAGADRMAGRSVAAREIRVGVAKVGSPVAARAGIRRSGRSARGPPGEPAATAAPVSTAATSPPAAAEPRRRRPSPNRVPCRRAEPPAAEPRAAAPELPLGGAGRQAGARTEAPPEDAGPGEACRGPRLQPVTVISSPGGATATLDGRSETACTTPCSLDAAPGRHTVALAMPGYQMERRDVEVGSGPVEMPPVVLRSHAGTLMLSSDPAGAAVLVNGRRVPQTTPAQLPLAPGTYQITVEKDGRQSTSSVEIRNGEIKSLRVLLGP